MVIAVMPEQPPAPPPPPVAPPAPVETTPAAAMLAYADRVRGLTPPNAAAELSRLTGQDPTPGNLFQMALVLMQTRAPGDSARAAQLLQRVQAEDTPEARTLHPLARQLLAHLTEQRRLEETVERQSQQLRDIQRRADQLQDRLEALRAIERARPNRPATP